MCLFIILQNKIREKEKSKVKSEKEKEIKLFMSKASHNKGQPYGL